MTGMSRRTLLTGAAAVAAAGNLNPLPISQAQAQTTPTLTGVYRYKLGDAEVIQVLEGIRNVKLPERLITNLSKEQVIAAFEAAHMPTGIFVNPFCPSVIKSGGKTIVIDTGNGMGAIGASNGEVGHHRANLQLAGIDVKSVDIVLISHFHGDHINGLKNPDGTPAYPNAEIKVPAAEWAFFTDESNVEKASATNKGNFPNVKKVFEGLKPTQYESGKEVAPGITSIASPGHTPGHHSFVVSSGSKRVLIQGDIALAPLVFVRNPDYRIMFDNDPDLAVTTRKKMYDMAIAEKLPIIGYHFPFGMVGYVEKAGNGYNVVNASGLS